MSFTVNLVRGEDFVTPLRLLEGFLREGEPLPESFIEQLRRAVQAGAMEVLAAKRGNYAIGVAVLAYRLNVSVGGLFASIEDLYVLPEERSQGVGRALIEEVRERCATRRVSYVEVQVEDGGAEAFYSVLGYELESGMRVLSSSYVF